MARDKIFGVGTPTGQEINRSNPGFNRQFAAGQITEPNLGLRYSRKTISVIELDLATPVTDQQKKINGTFLYYGTAVDNTNAALVDRPIFVRFDRTSSDAVRLLPGMMLSGFPFDTLYITIPAGYDAGDVGQLIVTVDAPDDRVRAE